MDTPPRRRLVLPWKTRVALFFLGSATDAVRRSDGTVNRRLIDLADTHLGLKTKATSKPDRNGVTATDVTVDPARNVWFRLFVPPEGKVGPERLPVVVFFHGGGFVYMSAHSKAYDAVCRRFSRQIPAVVVSVNYRLAPEHRYPAQYEDGFHVLRFLDEKNDAVLPPCADLSRCFLAGDSAGGNIVHHVTVRMCKEHLIFTNLKVIGVLNIQPFFGGEERTKAELELGDSDVLVSRERTDWMWKAFMPDADRDHPVINVSGPRAEDISKLDNFPPVKVVIAGFDSLKDWQMRYYEWLKNSGKEVSLVEFPNTFHAFYIFPEVPESPQLMIEAKKFVEDCWAKVAGN